MSEQVIINGYTIETESLNERKAPETNQLILELQFKVKHEDYHEVTTLLYKNDFTVEVPTRGIKCNANISNYSTSVTNLYEKDSVGTFKLELIEK
ncbi:DUF3219 family protein [Ornithinibacillus halophilus]|uniref:DUF3219 domain-containing protein n=1 Tax=Ornithinibacillus halophilus TaxID=930117 RepID=A0A1M5GDH8_9BACI|nr:DUF3219 family protein [Ornithinibacillus halophilus]SHG01739.1 Protein of unknown function [Ornithinibacillus halophilus]